MLLHCARTLNGNRPRRLRLVGTSVRPANPRHGRQCRVLHVGMAHASLVSRARPRVLSGGKRPRQAAENGNLEMVKTLIDRKADVGCVREDGQVSLLLAAARGKVRAHAL